MQTGDHRSSFKDKKLYCWVRKQSTLFHSRPLHSRFTWTTLMDYLLWFRFKTLFIDSIVWIVGCPNSGTLYGVHFCLIKAMSISLSRMSLLFGFSHVVVDCWRFFHRLPPYHIIPTSNCWTYFNAVAQLMFSDIQLNRLQYTVRTMWNSMGLSYVLYCVFVCAGMWLDVQKLRSGVSDSIRSRQSNEETVTRRMGVL